MDNKVFPIYRNDIDVLRAIAVLAVILFHMGYLPNGYLGVDVFFVISGYLITKIIYVEAIENKFSIYQFYLRRIRRIIPLVLFTTFVALITGLFVMLPDDLENLSQSVIATNFFANNILLKITTVNYWNIINDYKPLMHTWSLGIEEQFYLVYPLLFLICNKKRVKWVLPILVVLTGFSLLLFVISTNEAAKFFTIPFRFLSYHLEALEQ
ncbi:acyltransferase family protein [Flavobacterium myungsuense]|uniref:acyltransferase family protein n=1 Tax=Flavobacterium myungsuense TaxID=651823 RepID=UPI00362C27C1